VIRDGGGVREWLWKGFPGFGSSYPHRDDEPAVLEVRVARAAQTSLRYRIAFAASGSTPEIVDEALEEADGTRNVEEEGAYFYRYREGNPVLNMRRGADDQRTPRQLDRGSLAVNESILSQRRDPELYPELTWCAQQFARIQVFAEWSFGRYTALRQPQPADLPHDVLLRDARNLGLILNQLELSDASSELTALLRRFLPRFKRITTSIQGGTVQIFLHEDGLTRPIPATRLSDGTIRFLAMAALLVMPAPPPLICIEEPELGLHPDALAVVAEMLVSASARTQLIVTTHSDALVSALTEHIESVLVCEYREGTQFTRLDAGRLQHWLERYRLGDLWRMGELGGNP
jgi:predicted ATPase